jgi:hypothetical protein
MTLKETIQKMMGKEEEEEYEAKEVIDRHLDSLRREDQFQNNQEEKEYLKKKIAEYKKAKMKEHLYGIKDKREQEKTILGQIHKKKAQIMKKRSMLRQKKRKKSKPLLNRKNMLSDGKKQFKKTKKIKIL